MERTVTPKKKYSYLNYLKRKQINMESSMTEMMKKIKTLEKKFSLGKTDIETLKENWLKKFFFDYCNIKICNGFVSLYGNIFKSMDNHSYELMKVIVSCFLSIRFKSHARLINERIKKQNLRSKLMKIILHNHQ